MENKKVDFEMELAALKKELREATLKTMKLSAWVGELERDNEHMAAALSDIVQRVYQMVEEDDKEARERIDEIIVRLYLDSGAISYSHNGERKTEQHDDEG